MKPHERKTGSSEPVLTGTGSAGPYAPIDPLDHAAHAISAFPANQQAGAAIPRSRNRDRRVTGVQVAPDRR